MAQAVSTRSVGLDPQHPLAPARQVLGRRTPHRAETAGHDIEMRRNVGLAIRRANRTYCDDSRFPLVLAVNKAIRIPKVTNEVINAQGRLDGRWCVFQGSGCPGAGQGCGAMGEAR